MLTPLESQLKDIVVNLYSDKKTVPRTTAKSGGEGHTFVQGDVDLHQQFPTSLRLSPEGLSYSDSEHTLQSSLPIHLQRSHSSPTPELSIHSDTEHHKRQLYSAHEPSESLSNDGEESLSWPKSKPETRMSDSTPRTSDFSSGFIFTADDTALEQTDPEAPPIHPPVLGPQYRADHPSFKEPVSHEGGEVNRPLALRQRESEPFSIHPDAFMYMYSHTDSSYSKPYPPKPSSVTSEARSGVIESFGIEALDFQPHGRSSQEHHSLPPSSIGDIEPPNIADQESVDASDGQSLEAASRDRSLTPVADIGMHTTELPPGWLRDQTPNLTAGVELNYQATKASRPHTAAEPRRPDTGGVSDGMPGKPWQADIPLELPPHRTQNLQPYSPVLSMSGSSTPHSAGDLYSEESGQPRDASVYALTGLEDVETNSVVSAQQLTDSLQNEPPETRSLLDDMQALESGRGSSLVPFAPSSSHMEQQDPSLTRPYSPFTPKRPLSLEKPLTSPTAARIPYHLQPSPNIPRKPAHTPTKAPSAEPFSPMSSTPAPTTKPVHGLGLPPRRTTSTSSAGASDCQDETDDRVKALEHELTQALQAKANLEGQVESIIDECKEALKNRAELHMKLAKAETELSELAEALSRERAREKQRPVVGGTTEELALQKELEDVKQELREARDDERKTEERHKQETDREKQALRMLKDDLAESLDNLKAKDEAISELRDKLKSTQTALEHKAVENEEAACKLSSLEASYDALEGSKSWLHDQLQEALESKMKLQEELRESKTATVSHGIKAGQLEKENETLQCKVTDLQRGVLQDKARLVSELEAIEADVLSREDSYAQLVAEKAQLEDLAKMRGRNIEQLNHSLAQAQVQNEALEQKLGEISPEKDALVRETQNLKRRNKDLEKTVHSFRQELDSKDADLAELEKLKSTLQERLRQSDALVFNKEGTVQGLNEAKEILKQELEMEQQARDSMEKELSDARREVAELEGDLKAACDKNREKDALLRDLSNTQQSIAGQKFSVEARLAEKDEELAQKVEQLKAFEAQSSELVDEFKSLQGQFHSIAAESGVVKDGVAEKDRVIAHLSTEKERMDEELASFKRESEQLKDKLAQLQHEKARLEGTIEASSPTSLEEFQRAIQEKAQLQTELNTVKVNQQRESIKAQAKVNRSEADLKSANKEAAKAKKELEKIQQEKDQVVCKLQEDVSCLEDELRNVQGKLDRALRDKGRLENSVEALKPSEGHVASLSSECERLSRQNQDLTEQLQREATQRAEVERASGMVATKLKQNAKEKESGLEKQLKDSSLQLERLKGRLAGMNTTQVAMRDHTASLEATLARKEAALIKLSAQVQKVLEEKEIEDKAFADRTASLENDLDRAKQVVKAHKDKEQFLDKKIGELERDVRQKEAKMEDLKYSLSQNEVPLLEKKVAKLVKDKDELHSEVSSLKSQLAVARASVGGVKRDLADKNSQIDILTRELNLAKAREKQGESEMKQLQDRLTALDETHASEMRHLQRSLSEGNRGRGSTAVEDGGGEGQRKGLFDASLSSIGLDEDTDAPQHIGGAWGYWGGGVCCTNV